MEREIILEVKDLHKIYGAGENAVKALDGIDLKVYSPGTSCDPRKQRQRKTPATVEYE